MDQCYKKKLLTKNQYVINGVINGGRKKKKKKKYYIERVFPNVRCKIDDTMAKGNESINRNMRKFSNQREMQLNVPKLEKLYYLYRIKMGGVKLLENCVLALLIIHEN